MQVRLVPFDEPTLDALVVAALADADPDEVTPPLGEGWTPQRLAWLREYHLAPRPRRETWAVVADGAVVGAVRLTPVGGSVEAPDAVGAPTRPDPPRTRPDPPRARPDVVRARPDVMRTRPDAVRARPDGMRDSPVSGGGGETRLDAARVGADAPGTRSDAARSRPDGMRDSPVEVGMWLVRSARGRGVGGAALRLALDLAGPRVVVANTTATNTAAVAVLRRLGFATEPGEQAGAVRAERSGS